MRFYDFFLSVRGEVRVCAVRLSSVLGACGAVRSVLAVWRVQLGWRVAVSRIFIIAHRPP